MLSDCVVDSPLAHGQCVSDGSLKMRFYAGINVSEIEELEARVRQLPRGDFTKFRDWFLQLDDDRWDAQIQSDFNADKIRRLIDNARDEFVGGKAREL